MELPVGAFEPLGGAFFVGGTSLFSTAYGRRKITYFDKLWFKYFTCHLVPVLAPNYKQHILSPAKVSFLSVSQHAD
jgi:hypothetical protein